MGKRKKSGRSAPAKKKREGLPIVFSCLFCNHERSVTVKMDKKAGVGVLTCKACGQNFQSDINYLSAPVDVYYDWVDAADNVANDHSSGILPNLERVVPGAIGKDKAIGRSGYSEKSKGEDFVVDDEMDGEGEFAGVDDEDDD